MKLKFLKNSIKILLTVIIGTGGIYLIISGFIDALPILKWWVKVLIGIIFLSIGIPILTKLKLKK